MLNIAQPTKASTPSVNENALRRKEKYSFTGRKNRNNNQNAKSHQGQFNIPDQHFSPNPKREERNSSNTKREDS